MTRSGMLADRNVAATVAVKNLDVARNFYEGTLGLTRTGPENDEVAVYASGTATLVVYRSEYAGTNKATSATWGVGDDLEGIVATLKKAGVAFEHYDMPGAVRDGDVHSFGAFKAVWFRDPDGNILHLNNG